MCVEGLFALAGRREIAEIARLTVPREIGGGIHDGNALDYLEAVAAAGNGKVDLTIGSALDIFGGTGVRYEDAVAFNRREARSA